MLQNKGNKMQLKVYSIHDQKCEIFNTPYFQVTHGEAERNFKSLVNDKKSKVADHPEDYDLYYLGEYDDNKGHFKTLDTPQHMLKAIEVKTEQ